MTLITHMTILKIQEVVLGKNIVSNMKKKCGKSAKALHLISTWPISTFGNVSTGKSTGFI